MELWQIDVMGGAGLGDGTQGVPRMSDLVAEYDATLEVKDAKIEILETTVDAERERSELFKTMADTRKEGFFDSFLRKAGLIVGFAAGVAVGVLAN